MVRSRGTSSSTLPSELVSAFLERSSPCFIHSEVDQHSTNATVPVSVLPVELSIHAWRISSLSFSGNAMLLPDLPQLLGRSMPALEKLRIVAPMGGGPLTPLSFTRLPKNSLPHLRELSVSPGELFPHFAVRSLRNVSLSGCRSSIQPLESQVLLQALRKCPDLETLHFGDYVAPYDWPVLHEACAIHLPSLTKLEIFDTKSLAVLGALSALSVPSTALIHVSAEDTRGLSDFLPHHVFQRYSFDRVILRINESSSCRLECFSDHSQPLWVLGFDYRGSLGNLGLEEYFQGMHVTHLEVLDAWEVGVLNADRSGIDDWVVALRAFPHLTHLTVCGTDGPNLVLPALARCTTSSDPSVARLSCASLTNIALSWKITSPRGDPNEPTNLPEGCDAATYRSWDVEERVRWRCSMMQPVFEERALNGAPELHTLEFWEFETRRRRRWQQEDDVKDGELIPSTHCGETSAPCLAQLRRVVGGPVVYRGYLLTKE